MIRPSAQLRATIQRTTPPLLILLSAAIIILGKADQSMFESLRTKLTDDAAPALDVMSRPFGAAASLVDRVRGIVTMYQDNVRLSNENERLLQWQQDDTLTSVVYQRQDQRTLVTQPVALHSTRGKPHGGRRCCPQFSRFGHPVALHQKQLALT